MAQHQDGAQLAPVLAPDAATCTFQLLPGAWRPATVLSQTTGLIVRARCERDSLALFTLGPRQQVSARLELLVDSVLWARVRCDGRTGFCVLSDGGHNYLGSSSSSSSCGLSPRAAARADQLTTAVANGEYWRLKSKFTRSEVRQFVVTNGFLTAEEAARENKPELMRMVETCARRSAAGRTLPLCVVPLAGACAALVAVLESPLWFLPKAARDMPYERDIRDALLAQDGDAGAGVAVDLDHIAACRPHLLHSTKPHKRSIKLPKEVAAYVQSEHTQLRLRATQLLPERMLHSFASHIARATKVVVATGAGISVSAGIPDFRTKGTGLYSKLAAYKLPTPESLFDLKYFRAHPHAFYDFVRKMWPGNYRPTRAHHFIKLLHRKGKLLRNFTQNIDDLERVAGIPPSKLFQAHGTFSTARCVDCSAMYDPEYVLEHLERGEWPRCDRTPDCAVREVRGGKYQGLVKPGITFFGEDVDNDFANVASDDMDECDALIVLGTSLQVQPFSYLPAMTRPFVPRLMIDLEPHKIAQRAGFDFDSDWGFRDVCWAGQCDDGIDALCHMLGWHDELEALIAEDAAAGVAAPGPQ
eukprot:TRINITY_DN4957_c0_g1_i2.p1 TRINITY_DN4957_c0_g1~~TRINITY_DN4957_c0_g1_i2.p1  ORF type:complete len:656 (+),score=87.88 TRINITY_DN4957_c0_g1_i2:213-1970(+)